MLFVSVWYWQCFPSQDAVNDYRCECVAGFTGRNCEVNIDECQTAPCENNGTCIDQVNGYRCNCRQGFSDVNCSTNVDDCKSSLCRNNGDDFMILESNWAFMLTILYFLYISLVIKYSNHTERIIKYYFLITKWVQKALRNEHLVSPWVNNA